MPAFTRVASRALAATGAAVALALLLVTAGATAPTPSGKPPRWELRFEIKQDLRLVPMRGDLYWIMTFLVTNRTGEDQLFVPEAVLYTDAGDIIREGESVPIEVVNGMLDLLRNPLLESSTGIIGTIRQGKENAREGLLIWKAGDMDIDEVAVFIAGLSSETAVLEHPVTGEEITMRKTLERRYDAPGDPTADYQEPVVFSSERWIMR